MPFPLHGPLPAHRVPKRGFRGVVVFEFTISRTRQQAVPPYSWNAGFRRGQFRQLDSYGVPVVAGAEYSFGVRPGAMISHGPNLAHYYLKDANSLPSPATAYSAQVAVAIIVGDCLSLYIMSRKVVNRRSAVRVSRHRKRRMHCNRFLPYRP